MRIVLLLSLVFFATAASAQLIDPPTRFEDTIHLKDIRYKKLVAYYLEDATVVIDYKLFIKELRKARAALLKQKKLETLRIQSRLPQNMKILMVDFFHLQEPLEAIDSVMKKAKAEKSDTFRVYRQTFTRILPGFGDFLPEALEKNNCAVFDYNHQRQFTIIRRREKPNSAEWVSIGPAYYYLPGESRYFMSPVDWIVQKPISK